MKRLVRKMLFEIFAAFCRDVGGKIVFYHDVFKATRYTAMGTNEDRFLDHVAIARKSGFTFVRGVPSEDRQLQVCFDDGFRGIWDCREVFSGQHIYPTVYIAPGLVGNENYLRWDEISELQHLGFRFQCHTWSHRPLTQVPSKEWKHEMVDSRKCIEDHLGCRVEQLCFPCGYFSTAIIEACHDAGYCELLTSIPGSTRSLKLFEGIGGGRVRLLPRTLVQTYDSDDFDAVLHGALLPLAKRYYRKHFMTKEG